MGASGTHLLTAMSQAQHDGQPDFSHCGHVVQQASCTKHRCTGAQVQEQTCSSAIGAAADHGYSMPCTGMPCSSIQRSCTVAHTVRIFMGRVRAKAMPLHVYAAGRGVVHILPDLRQHTQGQQQELAG